MKNSIFLSPSDLRKLTGHPSTSPISQREWLESKRLPFVEHTSPKGEVRIEVLRRVAEEWQLQQLQQLQQFRPAANGTASTGMNLAAI